jgi:hypothetical protein
LALSALFLSHPAIKNLLARSLLSTWSLWGLIFPYRPQGQDEPTRPSWNVPFDKEKEKQVAKFFEKLTWRQPIVNTVPR